MILINKRGARKYRCCGSHRPGYCSPIPSMRARLASHQRFASSSLNFERSNMTVMTCRVCPSGRQERKKQSGERMQAAEGGRCSSGLARPQSFLEDGLDQMVREKRGHVCSST